MYKSIRCSRHIALLFMLSAIIAASCGSRNNQNQTGDASDLRGTISISGAFALYPITVRWAEEYRKVHPDVRIDISAGGAGKGMADAMSGMVDLGMFSRGLNVAEVKQGVWWVAVTKDAVLPVVNKKNPMLNTLMDRGMSKADFAKIYLTNNLESWNELLSVTGEVSALHVYTRSDACGAAQMWAEFVGTNQEDLNGIGVFGDPGIADAVKNDPMGIGYNNMVYVYDINTRQKYEGLEVIPIDLNGDGIISDEEDFYEDLDGVIEAISDGRYPSPPARPLYFVAAHRPDDPLVTSFLEWILTSGQQFVGEAGYVQLSQATIDEQLQKLHGE
ncbi:MAG TPA: PstS family phosphate ABC transporter substrate-binding protein [Bacteroidales bacterium]|nr:PstS family phosphate ABC transporter substrate-binding protein [Bacteroidales bacterium]